MPNINKHINKNLPFISPNENSHKGLCVPEVIFQYGSVRSKVRSLPSLMKYGVKCIIETKRSYRELYKQPNNAQKSISDRDLNDLIAYSKEIGVADIAFTPVDPACIFDHTMILYPNAIVISIEMEHQIINTAPSKEAEREIFRTYYELSHASNKIKAFLNNRGYHAEAGPALGGEVNYPLLGEKAGMGCIGKHGLLITPELGPSIRLAAVYTDIDNLPIKNANEHVWIKEFCKTCNRCVNKCPAGAIFKDPIVFEDGSLQCVDYKKCAVPFSTQRGCTLCIKECTFFRNNYEKIKKSFLKLK